MPYLNTNLVSVFDSIPDFVLTNGWSTSGSWTSTSNGVLDPVNNASRVSLDLAYTGPFQIRWNYRSLSSAATSTGFSLGIVLSANHPYYSGSFFVSSPDIRYVFDNPESNVTRYADNQTTLLNDSPKPNTSEEFQLSRDESNIIRYHRGGTLKATGSAMSGSIALVGSCNEPGTEIENLRTREFYSSDYNE